MRFLDTRQPGHLVTDITVWETALVGDQVAAWSTCQQTSQPLIGDYSHNCNICAYIT